MFGVGRQGSGSIVGGSAHACCSCEVANVKKVPVVAAVAAALLSASWTVFAVVLLMLLKVAATTTVEEDYWSRLRAAATAAGIGWSTLRSLEHEIASVMTSSLTPAVAASSAL